MEVLHLVEMAVDVRVQDVEVKVLTLVREALVQVEEVNLETLAEEEILVMEVTQEVNALELQEDVVAGAVDVAAQQKPNLIKYNYLMSSI